MRILILVDDAASVQPPESTGLWKPSARRDVTTLLPLIDPQRLEIRVCPVREELGARFPFDPVALRRLVRLVRDQRIELIHAMSQNAATYAALAGRLTDIPTLYSVYAIPPTPRYATPQYFIQRLRHLVIAAGVDHAVTSSEL